MSNVKSDSAQKSIFNTVGSFIKKFATVSVVYLAGYFDISIAWLIIPVLFAVFREEQSRLRDEYSKKQIDQADQKEQIISMMGELPSWVLFPDVEKVEWINKILYRLWPSINEYAQSMIKTTIEPQIQETLSTYKLSGFTFERMRLGSTSPRIGGIKVYEKHVSRKEIMMDMDISYTSDCDISFKLKGVSGGVKNFQIHGMMRIVLKPLIPTIPLVGGVQIFFLNNPWIDFNLVGAADLLDIPGISDILRKVIVEQVAAMMVLPNKLSIVLSDAIPAEIVKTPDPKGVLRVHVVQATKLMKKDISVLGGKSDPYATVTVGSQQFRTNTISNTVNPKWDFWCEALIMVPQAQEVKLDLWDWDPGFPGVQNDDFLGRVSVQIGNIIRKGELDTWLALEQVKHGMIHVRFLWYNLSTDIDDLKLAEQELKELKATSIHSAVFIMYIDSLQNLPDSKPNVKPDVCVYVTAGHSTLQTTVRLSTNNPVVQQGFSFLINGPENQNVLIRVVDEKTGKEIGILNFPLNNLLKRTGMRHVMEPFTLQKSGPESKILFTSHLMILKKAEEYREMEAKSKSDENTKELIRSESSESDPLLRKQISKEGSISSSSGIIAIDTTKPVDTIDVLSTSTVENPEIIETRLVHFEEAPPGNCGNVEMSLKYNEKRQCLTVVVHKIRGLKVKDLADLPDIYVKLYLLPKTKDTKRKTKVIKDCNNPVFEESFEYILSKDEIPYRQLNVSVISQKTSFVGRNDLLGQVTVELKEMDLSKDIITNFYLIPDIDTASMIQKLNFLKIKRKR